MQITKSFYRKLSPFVKHGDMVVCEQPCAIAVQHHKYRHVSFRPGDMFIMAEAFMESPLLDNSHKSTCVWVKVIQGGKVFNLDAFTMHEVFKRHAFTKVKV